VPLTRIVALTGLNLSILLQHDSFEVAEAGAEAVAQVKLRNWSDLR